MLTTPPLLQNFTNLLSESACPGVYMFNRVSANNRIGTSMAFDRLHERSSQYRWSAVQGEPLSHRSSYLIIAAGSILGWAIFISAGVAILRLVGLLV